MLQIWSRDPRISSATHPRNPPDGMVRPARNSDLIGKHGDSFCQEKCKLLFMTDSWMGAARAENAQRRSSQSHITPIILAYVHTRARFVKHRCPFCRGFGSSEWFTCSKHEWVMFAGGSNSMASGGVLALPRALGLNNRGFTPRVCDEDQRFRV